MPPEKTDYDPDLDRAAFAMAAGLVLAEDKPLHIYLTPQEATYFHRLVSADAQRMTEARDHAVSHGMRGYSPPDLEAATRVIHSLEMARTSAAIDAVERIEGSRQDVPS